MIEPTASITNVLVGTDEAMRMTHVILAGLLAVLFATPSPHAQIRSDRQPFLPLAWIDVTVVGDQSVVLIKIVNAFASERSFLIDHANFPKQGRNCDKL